MNSFEQQILDVIQDAFPLVERPYAVLAEVLGSDETTIFNAVEKMRASGVIRRIGGVYDSKKLGFISRLCAGMVNASVLDFSVESHDETPIEKFAAVVMGEPSITHNYIRSHEYNVWFTVIAENEVAIDTIVKRVCAKTELHDVHVFSATKKFKINTVMKGGLDERGTALCFDKLSTSESSGTLSPTSCHPERSAESAKSKELSESDRNRIRTACDDIPHTLTPFNDWGVSCDELREDLTAKRMRRFGAILRHQEAGFPCNAMVCFRIDERRETRDESGSACSQILCYPERFDDVIQNGAAVQKAGSILASNPHISHCYERPAFESFPYNVYAMMHANSAEQLNQYIADCVKTLNELQSSPVDYVVLRSLKELKKTSFKFFV